MGDSRHPAAAKHGLRNVALVYYLLLDFRTLSFDGEKIIKQEITYTLSEKGESPFS